MDRKKLKQYLRQKEWLWQNIFLLLYLQKHEISPADLRQSFDIAKCVDFCRNEDDICDLWTLIDELDEHYCDIEDCIDNIRYCKPIPWQYDFAAIISRIRQIPIQQTLSLDAVVIAYTLALSLPSQALREIYASLDKRHQFLINSLNRKQSLLKRNLLMLLECTYGTKFPGIKISDIKFREILQTYIPLAGYKNFLALLPVAATEETKLTKDEKATLAFAYYSPFFYDEISLKQHLLPPSCLFSRAKEYLEVAYQYWQKKKRMLANINNDCDEDDFVNNNTVFVDTNEDCIIDARMEKYFYAHVYIRPVPPDSMKNYAGDYLIFRNNFLYSVEFVHDFSSHPETADFISRLKRAEKSLNDIQQKLAASSMLPTKEIVDYKQRQFEILRFINACYCVSGS